MRDRIIRICWSKAIPLEEAIVSELSKTQGLYYITRVFGKKETSIYLGIARYNNTIKHRLEGHRDWWLSLYRGAIYVRIGTIVYPKGLTIENKSQLIDHAESAILYEPEHKRMFPENISKRKSYTYLKLYRVENVGDIFELKPKIRMHEHENIYTWESEEICIEPNSILNRWENDPNPVRVSGKSNSDGRRIEIVEIPEEDAEEFWDRLSKSDK